MCSDDSVIFFPLYIYFPHTFVYLSFNAVDIWIMKLAWKRNGTKQNRTESNTRIKYTKILYINYEMYWYWYSLLFFIWGASKSTRSVCWLVSIVVFLILLYIYILRRWVYVVLSVFFFFSSHFVALFSSPFCSMYWMRFFSSPVYIYIWIFR